MMARPVTRRVLALLLLCVLLAGLYLSIVKPLRMSYMEQHDRVAELEQQLVSFTRFTRGSETLDAELDRLQGLLRTGPYSLPGDSHTLAAAALQERLKVTIEQYGGRLESTRILSTTSDEQLVHIMVSANAELPLAALQKVVFDLETTAPYVVVEELAIAARQIRWAGAAEADEHPELNELLEKLDVRINLSGRVPAS